MNDFDKFCIDLLEQSKRFLEKAKESEGPQDIHAFLNASLLLASSALEAYINGLSQELCLAKGVPLHIQAVLLEKEIKIEKGKFTLSDNLKISRLTDKVETIYFRHTRKQLDNSLSWWINLKNGLSIRNKITHPKEAVTITAEIVEELIKSIIDCISELYTVVYKRKFPKSRLSLVSKMTF